MYVTITRLVFSCRSGHNSFFNCSLSIWLFSWWCFLCISTWAKTRVGPPDPLLSLKGAIVTLDPFRGNLSKLVNCTTEKCPDLAKSILTWPFWVNSISGHSVPIPAICRWSKSHLTASAVNSRIWKRNTLNSFPFFKLVQHVDCLHSKTLILFALPFLVKITQPV